MQVVTQAPRAAGKRIVTGRILTGFAVIFLIFDGVAKVLRASQAVQATTVQLGFQPGAVPLVGVLLLACTAVFVVPRTAPLGALLLTGYLGGAVAANIRVGDPVFETIFPILFAILIWVGLVLRDERLNELLPIRRPASAR